MIHKLTPMSCIIWKKTERKRVGKQYDGGYIMFYPFSQNKIAYSFGINDDVSWEKEMVKNGYDIYMYDHTIRKLPERNEKFHWYKKGVTGGKESSSLERLDSLIKKNGHENVDGMVLKMDVEGAEWDVLRTLPSKVLLQFDQIVIELHGILEIKNKQTIFAALKKVGATHKVVHLHANNYGNVNFCNELITPNILEMTLVNKDKFDTVESNIMLPIMEDMPCNKRVIDIFLGTW